MDNFQIPGERIVLRLISKDFINEITEFYARNKARILNFNPSFPDVYLTQKYWLDQYRFRNSQLKREKALDFYLCLPDRPEKIVGHIRVFNIESCPRNSCEIGFTIDELVEGRGYMMEAIHLVLTFLHDGLNIHRVTAQCHQKNLRSQKLLSSLGFSEEGVLHEAMFIDGKWQDMKFFYYLL